MVGAVTDSLTRDAGLRAYTQGAVEFHKFVAAAAKATGDYLDASFAAGKPAGPVPSGPQLRLAALRAFWSILHAWAKPSADADTTAAPVSIVSLLERAARERGGGPAHLVLIHTPELNYFHHSREPFSRVYAQLGIQGMPQIPEGICLVAIPYSQSNRFLTNLCLFHEVGHFQADETTLAAVARPAAQREVRSLPGAQGLSRDAEAWLTDRLVRWAEEVFCDLFAARWLGAAYLLAFCETMCLVGLLDGAVGLEFRESHPAVAFRLAFQREQLEADGWWNALRRLAGSGTGTEYVAAADAATADPANYHFQVSPGSDLPQLVAAFVPVARAVREFVNSNFPPRRAAAIALLERNWAAMSSCLENGIVPSAALRHGESGEDAMIALANAAAYFEVAGLGGLAQRLAPEPGEQEVAHLARCLNKAEEWSLRGVEDLGYSAAAVSDGPV